MLIQWLISISLTAEIIFMSLQGFLLLSKIQLSQQTIVRESAEIRFLVGYLKAMMHETTEILSGSSSGELMTLISLLQTQGSEKKSERRLFLSESLESEGLTLAVQEERMRREVLINHLKSFSLKFCVQKEGSIDCRVAADTQREEIIGVEFNLEFLENPILDQSASLKNHHRWHFILSKHCGSKLNA